MHSRRPSARVSVLAASVALVAMLVAVPMASAASFSGGSVKLSIKLSGAKAKASGGALSFTENAGEATMNKQASGSLNFGASTTKMTITRGSKKIVLQSFVEKLTAGKGQITAKINGKGKAIAFFDQASANKLNSGDFTALTLPTVSITLTKTGAAALNKAFGLKAPARGQKDLRYKAKAKAGTSSFVANRSLTVTGGESRTVYDTAFVDTLRSCGIDLGAVAPATAIPVDESSAPRGGVVLPIKAVGGGTLNAKSLVGSINHEGGTVLNRDDPMTGTNQTNKPRYNSPLRDFVFGFQGAGNPISLAGFIQNLNLSTSIGTVVGGTPAATLTDGPGSVSLVGDLQLSDAASANLSQAAPPLGADCPIPAGSKIGRATMSATVG